MTDPIRVQLVRSGGFAGVTVRAAVDTGNLPSDEAKDVADLMAKIDLNDLIACSRKPVQGADGFQYDLTIERGGSSHHIRLQEQAVPPELKPLLTLMINHAQSPK